MLGLQPPRGDVQGGRPLEQPVCDASPAKGKTLPSFLAPSDGSWLPLDPKDVVDRCARIAACMIATDPSTPGDPPGDPGLDCQKAPSKFKLDWATREPCARSARRTLGAASERFRRARRSGRAQPAARRARGEPEHAPSRPPSLRRRCAARSRASAAAENREAPRAASLRGVGRSTARTRPFGIVRVARASPDARAPPSHFGCGTMRR